ncbi:MAG: branched-chain amino acid ABC transporter substrate-binding protein [Wenzhouxiangellaceae bacterium]
MNISRSLIYGLGLAFSLAGHAATDNSLKVAIIDPLSGPFAATGQNLHNSYEHFFAMANHENWDGTQYRLDIVPFDSGGDLQQSLAQLQAAIDQGFHYIAHGTSSRVAAAFIEALNQHNAAHPQQPVLFLNHSAVDPVLTNEQCSFWHFRFDAHSDMKMEALTRLIATEPSISKVYIIGQDYSFGHQVSEAARAYLQHKRPDIEIVGDEFHPVARVSDFAPFIERIANSGADAIVTGNWGTDLARLIEAAHNAHLEARFFTLYAGMSSEVMKKAMQHDGEQLIGKVTQIGNWHSNIEGFPGKLEQETFKQKYHTDFYATPTYTITRMLSKAIGQTESIDPLTIAHALEGMTVQGLGGGDATMRAADHQIQQTQFLSTWVEVNGEDVYYDWEDTGYGWRTDLVLGPEDVGKPTTCKMQRPDQTLLDSQKS